MIYWSFTPDNNHCNLKKFLHCFVTFDETWTHWYISEIKEQSKQWTSAGEPSSKKTKTVLLPGIGPPFSEIHKFGSTSTKRENGHRALLCRFFGSIIPLRLTPPPSHNHFGRPNFKKSLTRQKF